MVTWQEGGRELLAHARRVAMGLREDNQSTSTRFKLSRQLLLGSQADDRLRGLSEPLTMLSIGERHYWAGLFYTLLMPVGERRAQAAYFTPPYLAQAILEMAKRFGFDLLRDTVLDPAAGGAAFLSTIAAEMVLAGGQAADICTRLHGVEIDPGLARISRLLIAERLGLSCVGDVQLNVGDALRKRWKGKYGFVVANPPYGRITPTDLKGDHWKEIAHSGHINKYAVFAELCFRAASPHGLIALVIPSSFRTGPLYKRMRNFLRTRGDVLAVASLASRDEVFADVAQDISVLIVRKTSATHRLSTEFSVIHPGPQIRLLAKHPLPANLEEPWPTPAERNLPVGGATLADYGVNARAGYFVWNRQTDRLKKARGRNRYPLIWAKNIRAGRRCQPRGKDGAATDFVLFRKTDSERPIVREPAIVLQRTTNDKQPRRLIAALVDPSVVAEWGGFVSENHTILLTGERTTELEVLCRLLNTAAVDRRYRRLSGTAAVSVQLLRQLDLPTPSEFAAAMMLHRDAEKAAEAAYEASSVQSVRDVA